MRSLNHAGQLSAWSARAVHMAAGLVLLLAALLKGYQLSSGPAVEPLLGSRAASTLGVLAEVALGSWLLTGAQPAAARVIAILCFATFVVVSVRQATLGLDSCGCFGAVRVTPWATAVLDLVLVGLLVAARPAASPSRYTRVAAATVVIAVVAGWLTMATPPQTHLAVTPRVIDLGSVEDGRLREGEVAITNTSTKAIRVTGVRSSCPCLTILLDALLIQPDQTAHAAIKFDPSREPGYIGHLEVQVEGLGDNGRPVFRFAVRVRMTR